MNTQTHAKTLWMAQTAILAAIIILMAFTPLGYLRAGPIEITFLTIPVVVGAILIGPASGAFLGAVFGATSFATAFSSVFGAALLAINPFYTFILTMIPRILMGWLVGLIFRALFKIDKTRILSYTIASLSGALLNTVLFVGTLFLFFGNSDYLRSFGESTIEILGVLITVNAAVEAAATMVLGAAVTKGLSVAIKHRQGKTAKS
ncbi:MAG: ECF transporter S component [Bacillota bacterium]|nr:ECF transporter S component [Bacillota bacterium]